jgi:aminopeptidase N
MLIPVRLGFLGQNGAVMPLTLDGENAQGPDERVLELREAEQTYVFTNLTEEPLVSIGRGFSAPVKFMAPLTRKGRATLMQHDPDTFNRWESGQVLATEMLLDMAAVAGDGQIPEVDPIYVDAIGEVLMRAEEDPAFAAFMLMPPLESELAMAKAPVNPDAIHAARMALIRTVATAHRARFEALYRASETAGPYSPDAAPAGLRSLRNATLRYLTSADDDAAAVLADRHYRTATNMTESIAGLAALSRTKSPLKDKAFADFHDRFRNDPLVLDKWFALQAGSPLPDTVQRVRALMSHAAFDIKNPNRVRSLVGAFTGNHLRFHARDGEGYALVGKVIGRLDGINPQIASRMAGAFENWRRYDVARQTQMRTILETLLARPGRSANLFEVTQKMLG